MSRYKSYPKYADSGIEWVAKFPAHWSLATLRWLTTRYAGGTPDKATPEYWEGGDIPWLNSGAVNDGYIVNPSDMITRLGFEKSSAKWIPEKALVVALAGQGKTKGTVAQLGIRTTCNQSMAAIIPGHTVIARHLFWWLTANYANIRSLAGDDARDGLNLDILASIPYPVVSLKEQEAISVTLDRETTRIDDLIAQKERFIELLKKKRHALITKAVTKGLDPNVSFKHSGVEWIGDIPQHWKIIPLKHLIEPGSSISYGIVQPGDPQSAGVPFVQTTNMTMGDFRLDRLQRTTPEIAAAYPRSKLQGGEVLLGIRASIGAAAVAPIHLRGANLSRGVARISCSDRLMADYLVAILSSDATRNYWLLSKQGSTFNEVSIETVRNMPVPVPPKNEQKNIIVESSSLLDRIAALVEKTKYSILLLRERRSSLITAAVTGKIDMREAA